MQQKDWEATLSLLGLDRSGQIASDSEKSR